MRLHKDSQLRLGADPGLFLKLVLALIASLGVLAYEKREAGTTLRSPFLWIIDPLKQVVSAPFKALGEAHDWFERQDSLLLQNRKLQEEALMLRGRQLRFEALEQENTRLRGLLDNTFKVGDQVLIAEPLLIGIVPYEHLITVNKGTRHGVREGQAVVDGNGLVGQVLKVIGRTSDIILITDPSHATPVEVNRTGLRTLALGTGQTDRLDLPYLPGNANLEPGDLLVTSGLDGVFPGGYPVAEIQDRPEGPEGTSKRVAVPIARFDQNREVLIVKTDPTPLSRIPEKEPEPEASDPKADGNGE